MLINFGYVKWNVLYTSFILFISSFQLNIFTGNRVWLDFKKSTLTPQFPVMSYYYTSNVFLFQYFEDYINFYKFEQLKRRFILHWVHIWHFLLMHDDLLKDLYFTIAHFYMLRVLYKLNDSRSKSRQLNLKLSYLFIRKYCSVKVFMYEIYMLELGFIHTQFIGCYFLFYLPYFRYQFWTYRVGKLLIKRLTLAKFNFCTGTRWLLPYIQLSDIKLNMSAFWFRFNNFFFYKWTLFLLYFRLNSSLLTLVISLKTSIVAFNRKHVMLPYTTSYPLSVYNKTTDYNRFLFFSYFSRFVRRHVAVNVIWLSVLVPRSFDLARRQFYYFYRKAFMYQRQITKYVLYFYRFTVYEMVKIQEFTLSSIILRSQFCFFSSFVQTLFKRRCIFLNFNLISSLFIVVCPFDIIQLNVSLGFYLFYRWQILYIDLRFNRFLFYSRFWIIRSHRLLPKQNSYRLPHWVLFYRFFFFEIPIYLEVDFFILTIVLLHYYYNSLLFYYYFSFKEISYNVVRNHNWKLLN